MFPLGDEPYHHGVEQPLLFVNTETFQHKKNLQKIKAFLDNDTGRLTGKYACPSFGKK